MIIVILPDDIDFLLNGFVIFDSIIIFKTATKSKREKIDYITISKQELETLLNQSSDGDLTIFKRLSPFECDISYSYFLFKHKLKKIVNIKDAENVLADHSRVEKLN